MATAADRQTQWARLVIDSLVQAGVQHAIISPGSRSTPFVIAALEQKGLECISAIDERSAAHYALGCARAALVPTLVLCTSGSAAANYFPAVMEANEAGVPLIVLSADRPPELHHCGVNQTTEQIGLYGGQVRFFANLGEPREDEHGLRATRRLIVQTVSEATGAKPGPVHINAQARKPLEPVPSSDALRAQVDRILSEPITEVYRTRSAKTQPLEDLPASIANLLTEALDSSARPVILCGPADSRSGTFAAVMDVLCERSGVLLLAEASSQLRYRGLRHALGAFDTIWRTDSGQVTCLPDFVLQLGAAPISKGWEELCSHHRIRRVVVHPWKWADPSSDAYAIVQADLGSVVNVLGRADFRRSRRDEAFASRLRRAESVAWSAADTILAAAGDELTEAGVARTVVDSLPSASALVLGNSLPIRDVETWTPPNDKQLSVYCQRGISGIDGVISGAAGVASMVDGCTTLLIGDVSFLHDFNGLQLAVRARNPLVIVVIQNGGGRIFEQLPIARSGKASWLPYFTTPHGADLASAAAAYGCSFVRTPSVSGLRQALESAHKQPGCTVIEAVVSPTSALELGHELLERVERALRREAP
jgi:2-succinyl-5-enolpyruvyl-6-hydroxy-3-cyclohexene-1-carboxylate synthase